MGLMIIHHKVTDYGKWKPVFDSHAGAQKAAGLTNARIFRGADNPNEVVVTLDMQDVEKAKQFAASPELKEKMKAAGVNEKPVIYYLNPAS